MGPLICLNLFSFSMHQLFLWTTEETEKACILYHIKFLLNKKRFTIIRRKFSGRYCWSRMVDHNFRVLPKMCILPSMTSKSCLCEIVLIKINRYTEYNRSEKACQFQDWLWTTTIFKYYGTWIVSSKIIILQRLAITQDIQI